MFQVLVTISQSFVAEKRHGAIQKLFMKKKNWEKNGHKSFWDIKNNGYLNAHMKKKKEMNKIASVLSQKYF